MNTEELSNRLTQIVQGLTNTHPIRIKACLLYTSIIGKEKLIYTRDLFSGVPFSLFYGKDKYKGYFYNQLFVYSLEVLA